MIQKFLHITLIITVLLSSIGFVVQRHFCQNELKSVSVFIKAESCHKNMAEESSCPMHKSEEHNHDGDQEKKDCCDDTVELVKLEQELQAKSLEVQLQNNPFLLGIISLALRVMLPEEAISPTYFLNYTPPLLVCDFTVSLQTFLC